MNPADGDRPLRVVQIVTTMARGGAQATVVASSAHRSLAAIGDRGPDPSAARPVDVRILAGPDRTGEGSFWGDPVLDDCVVEVVPDLVRSIRPHRDLRALRWLVARLRADRPDVVHTHSSKAGTLGRLAAAAAGVPCVHTVHGWGPLEAAGPMARRGVVAIESALAHRTAALVVVGLGDLDLGLSLGIGRQEQYRIIRSGIELPNSVPASVPNSGGGPGPELRDEVRRELGLDGRWVVGMVGRLAQQKDQASLIEAFARTGQSDATLVLVGDGPQRATLEAMAAARPESDIRFLGSRPDGARLVAGFDVAVNASLWEGLPRTVVEAAAAGVPVVASDVGSTGDLIRPGRSGRLVPPRDPSALADAVADARRDPATTARLVVEARRLAQDYSVDRMRRDLDQLWAEVAGRGRGPRRVEAVDSMRSGRLPTGLGRRSGVRSFGSSGVGRRSG